MNCEKLVTWSTFEGWQASASRHAKIDVRQKYNGMEVVKRTKLDDIIDACLR